MTVMQRIQQHGHQPEHDEHTQVLCSHHWIQHYHHQQQQQQQQHSLASKAHASHKASARSAPEFMTPITGSSSIAASAGMATDQISLSYLLSRKPLYRCRLLFNQLPSPGSIPLLQRHKGALRNPAQQADRIRGRQDPWLISCAGLMWTQQMRPGCLQGKGRAV